MKHNIFAIAITAGTVLTMTNAFADSGTVNFTGEILETACEIDSNAQNLTVDLGKYNKNELSEVGKKSVAKQFNITLKDCPAGSSSAQVRFEGTQDPTDSSLLALDNTPGAATGVAIKLLNSDMSNLALNQDSKGYSLSEGSDNVLNFFAQYQATSSTVTAGPATSVANFSVVYN
ncbi:fimbrial protein [Enterobacter sp. ENT02]|uniref:fimbrial protein n=1 Tax=Enterobacter sp. ENT02 TaxID=2854767 RepID=UPI001C458137|nr:fimbrial protein [Enterobacter sp. ENT02]MBV7559732.1 fimbrial protein [Enterobacter sp. ENT02]